jgi:hypothetical protein
VLTLFKPPWAYLLLRLHPFCWPRDLASGRCLSNAMAAVSISPVKSASPGEQRVSKTPVGWRPSDSAFSRACWQYRSGIVEFSRSRNCYCINCRLSIQTAIPEKPPRVALDPYWTVRNTIVPRLSACVGGPRLPWPRRRSPVPSDVHGLNWNRTFSMSRACSRPLDAGQVSQAAGLFRFRTCRTDLIG